MIYQMQVSYQFGATDSDASLERHRAYFASFVTAYAGVQDPRIWAAFAETRRERFVGPGPWRVYTPAGWLLSPTDNPRFVYQDATIALRDEGDIPSGRPTVHAGFLQAVAPRPNETVVHIGCGAGYYTAILARLVGPGGQVIAYEVVPDLATRAVRNLSDMGQVEVRHRSGVEGPFPVADLIYVNAGATDVPAPWLDALKPRGRLLLPLTPSTGHGGMLLIERLDRHQYSARFIQMVMFVPCIGARDEESAQRLAEAFQRGDAETVKSLRRGPAPHGDVWCQGDGWWLSRCDP